MPSGVHLIDPSGRTARFDGSTHAQNGIDYAHHEVHAGCAFVTTDIASLGAAATKMYLIVTPDSATWAHMIIGIETALSATIDLYEGTARAGGNALVEVNRNRNSASVATLVLTDTPGAGADGNQIWTTRLGNATGPATARAGGDSRGVTEWVLKQNESYLLRVTSNAAGNFTTVEFDWYEHADVG